jgi:hypothetical protein
MHRTTKNVDTLCLQLADTVYDFYVKSFAGNDSSLLWILGPACYDSTLVGPKTLAVTGLECVCLPCGPPPPPPVFDRPSTSSTLPKEFALEQNSPNPFNPSTAIRYSIPEPAKVELRIYNILGQAVKTLVDEEQLPGFYQEVWDGTDERGKNLSSGIYLYQIRAGDKVQTKKMQLIK